MSKYNFTQKATVNKWSVQVDPEACYGYFEPDSGIEGGGLWFSKDKELTDYDGRFSLPRDVWLAVEKLGYFVDSDFK